MKVTLTDLKQNVSMNVLLLDNVALMYDIVFLDDTLDDEEDRINDEAAWEWFEEDDDYDFDQEAYEQRSALEAVVIGKTDIPVERVIKMSDKELNELVDKLL